MKKCTLKSRIYDAIMDGIIKDEYKPETILNEKFLVDKFGVSKAPVREALLTLCNEGVLRSIPRCGYEVVKLTSKDVIEILNFRCILECGYIAAFCGKLTPEQITTLNELNKRCCDQTSGDDMWTHWEHNKKFHLQLISFGGNAYAYKDLERSLAILRRAYAQFYWDKWNDSVISSDMKSHKNLINAIAHNDLRLAQQYLKEDLADFGY